MAIDAHTASHSIDSDLITELNETLVRLQNSIPDSVIEMGLRKMVKPEQVTDEGASMQLVNLAAAMLGVLHLFTPSLTGARPIDRFARLGAAKGGLEAKALASLAASKFHLLEVSPWDQAETTNVRDLVTGETFEMTTRGLDPLLANFDVATRLCPLGAGAYWPLGPFVPLGAKGMGAAKPFPTRPGKGLINALGVATQLCRDYVRAGAPFGVDFGLSRDEIWVTYTDEALDDWAFEVRKRREAPTPDDLARVRTLASAWRLGVALSGAAELAEGGIEDGAALYRAAARAMMEVLGERMRVGSSLGGANRDLRDAVDQAFDDGKMPDKAAALFEALMRQLRPESRAKPEDGDDLARVIERIRALRLKTVELGCTEPEAMRAAEKVAEMLERYGLTLSEIELRKQVCEGFGFDTGRKQSAPIDEAFRYIAHFCDCRNWTEKSADGGIRQVFFGLPVDIEAARCLKDLVEAAFEMETEAFKRSDLYRDELGPGRRAMLKSFEIGLGRGISQKLNDLKAARDKAASRSTGRDLVVVKRSILDEELEKLGLQFRSKAAPRKKVIADAYSQGVAAAHRFEVNDKIG